MSYIKDRLMAIIEQLEVCSNIYDEAVLMNVAKLMRVPYEEVEAAAEYYVEFVNNQG